MIWGSPRVNTMWPLIALVAAQQPGTVTEAALRPRQTKARGRHEQRHEAERCHTGLGSPSRP